MSGTKECRNECPSLEYGRRPCAGRGETLLRELVQPERLFPARPALLMEVRKRLRRGRRQPRRVSFGNRARGGMGMPCPTQHEATTPRTAATGRLSVSEQLVESAVERVVPHSGPHDRGDGAHCLGGREADGGRARLSSAVDLRERREDGSGARLGGWEGGDSVSPFVRHGEGKRPARPPAGTARRSLGPSASAPSRRAGGCTAARGSAPRAQLPAAQRTPPRPPG